MLSKCLKPLRNPSTAANHTLLIVKEVLDFLTQECNQHEGTTYSTNMSLCITDIKFSNTPKSNHHTKPVASKAPTMFFFKSVMASDNVCSSCAACNQTNHKTYKLSCLKSQRTISNGENVSSFISCVGMHDVKIGKCLHAICVTSNKILCNILIPTNLLILHLHQLLTFTLPDLITLRL